MILRLLSIRRGITEEELSAYVDGTLDASARARVEAEAASSPETRRRLEALHATVSILQSGERVRAPRSFALTPAMAYGPAKPIRAAGISPLVPGLAAAAATLVVGLLVVGNVIGTLRQSGGATRFESLTQFEGAARDSASIQVPESGPGRAAPEDDSEPEASTAPEAADTGAAAEAKQAEATVPAMASISAGAVQATPKVGVVEATPGPKEAGALLAPESIVPPSIAPSTTELQRMVAPATPQAGDATAMAEVATPLAAEEAPVEKEAVAGQVDRTGPSRPAGAPADGAAREALPGTPAEGAPPADIRAEEEFGIALPLWQIEAGVAGLAVALGTLAALMALSRRRTPTG